MSSSRAAAFFLACALGPAPTTHAQQAERWAEELGDTKLSDVAEAELFALGPKAMPALLKVLDDWQDRTARDRARLRRALILVDLFGEVAVPLVDAITAAGQREQKELNEPIIHALAALTPGNSVEPWHTHFHRMHGGDDDSKAVVMRAFLRHALRSSTPIGMDVAAARQALASDQMFAREVAAEVLARAGDTESLQALHDRLLARERPGLGHDALRHNGFVVPLDDRFAQRASDSMIRLAPDDARTAVAYGVRAAVHPLRLVRLSALRALGRFGPDAKIATPELVLVAERPDDELAVEALKILGMVGTDIAPFLPTIAALTARSGSIARLANGVVTRAKAMGIAVPASPSPGDAMNLAAIKDAVDGITDVPEAANDGREATVLAHPELAWPVLLRRFQRDYRQTPDRVLRLLGRLTAPRAPAERDTLRYAIASLSSDNWHGPMFSQSSSGDNLRLMHFEIYGELLVGGTTNFDELVQWLAHKNTPARLLAARALATLAHREPDATSAWPNSAITALLAAATAEVPEKCEFETAANSGDEMECNVGPLLQTAAAAALVACKAPADQQGALLGKVLAYTEEAVVVRAIEQWATAANSEALERACNDPRPAVATAAKAARTARASK